MTSHLAHARMPRLSRCGVLAALVLCLAGPVLAQDFLATGSYTGDGTDGRAITGVGFAPDLVIIKGVANDHAYIRTATMPAGLSGRLAAAAALESGRLVSLDADGFTIDGDNAVNDGGKVFHWVAMRTGTGHLGIGDYVGNGGLSRTISGLGFRPAAVLVISAEAERAILRTDDMGAFTSHPLDDSGSTLTGILSFSADGFTVGVGNTVNQIGKTYHYVAWPGIAGTVQTGSYTGDNATDRSIGGVGFAAEYVLVKANQAEQAVHRTASIAGDSTLYFSNTTARTGLVKSIEADGFTVGSDVTVNAFSYSYNWLAFANPAGPPYDVGLSMGADNPAPNAGEAVTFDLALRNEGTADTDSIQVAVTVPAGLTYAADLADLGTFDAGTGRWLLANLASGESTHLSLTCTVDAGAGGRTLGVSALASLLSRTDGVADNDSARVEIVVPVADLSLVAVVNDANPDVGDAVVFTVALTNLGDDDASGVIVAAPLPVGLSFLTASAGTGDYDSPTGEWRVGNVTASRTATLTLVASPDPGTGGSTLVVPFDVTAADQEDPQPANDSRSVAVTVTSTDLALAKSVDRVSPNEGEEVTFLLELKNNGPNTATGISVRDLLPTGLSFVSATPAAGAYDEPTGLWTIGTVTNGTTVTLELVAGVAAGTRGTTLTNNAVVFDHDQEDPNPGNDAASAAVTVNSADLKMTKSVDDPAPNEGATLVYSLAVTNAGANVATGVAVTDSLPAGVTYVSYTTAAGSYDQATGVWSIGSLAGGATASLQITAMVDAGTAGTTITNTARISASDLADPDTGNNRDDAAVTVASTDLQLTKTVDETSPNEGGTVTYTVTLTNAGPNDAGAVVVTDMLPAGLTLVEATPSSGPYDAGSGEWAVGALADGAVATLVLTATVDAGTAGTLVTNTATITAADLADPDPANNTDSAALTVSGTDVRVAKVVDDPTPEVGDTVAYTVTATNDGPNAAYGVVLRDILPGGLSFAAATPSRGGYTPADGRWTIGTLGEGQTATLILTATVDAAAAGENIINTAALVAIDVVDLDSTNDSDTAAIDVPAVVVTPVVTVRALAGAPVVARPGTAAQTVLQLELANRGARADTLRALTLTNLTAGADAPDQAAIDAEWSPLKVFGQRRGMAGLGPKMALDPASFSGGKLDLTGFDWVIGPGDTLAVWVTGAPSLACRDAAVLELGVAAADDIGVRQTVAPAGSLPLSSGQDLVVDGFVAAQAHITNVPSGSVAVETHRQLALTADLPSNGYLADSLYGLTLVNRGSAGSGTDISAMEAWADDGDGLFDAATDRLLGTVVNSGELWQLTGLSADVPVGGRRFFVTVDVAADATPGRTIRLELPVEHGDAVIMASGNDGPRDLPLANGGVLAITVVDRLVLTAESIAPGVVRPGKRGVPLLTVNLSNTYATERRLQSLVVTNATVADGTATAAERDGILTQVVLRLDGDGDGVVDDFLTDPALGSGSFSGGTVTFAGLDLALGADELVRLFITGDVALDAAADGDVLAARIDAVGDVWAPGAAMVAAWPLDSDAAWRVDGMVVAQVTGTPVPGRTLGPGDGPEPALDIVVPANGYLADRLVGLSLTNAGDAVADDLAQVRLWADDGDGIFDSAADSSLGAMGWLNGRWVSPVLNHDVPLGGARLFVSIDAAAAPTDSATIRFTVPVDGIVMASANSGPLDTGLTPGGTLVLSTSALVSRVDFDTAATTVGRNGTVRMTVRNVGSETVSGITPTLVAGDGPGSLTLGAATPATLALAVGASADFVWTYTADVPGSLTLTGSAAGSGDVTALTHASAPAPSGTHRIYTAVPRLDTYPTANLPASVPRGQTNLVPLTLTLANPGDADVAVARLDSFVVRLAETATGPAIVPADLIGRVVLSEGSNVYLDQTALPVAGDEIVLRLSPPATITNSEPLTISLRIDLLAGSTAPSFLLSVDGAGSIHATDAVSGEPVTVVLGSGVFPVQTRQANLVSPAGGLEATSAGDTERQTQPGAAGVPLASLTLRNESTDPTASAIRVQSLGFVPRDIDGAVVADPDGLFDSVRVSSPSQTLFAGAPQYSDSLVVMQLTTPLDVPVGANILLDLGADIAADAPLGAVRFDFADRGQWSAADAADGAAVSVAVLPGAPNAGLRILAPVADLAVSGTGLLPATLGRGGRDIGAMTLSLVHPGGPGAADAAMDSLVIRLRNAARVPLDPAGLLDRVRVVAAGATVGLLIDPAAADGVMTIGLAAAALAPGDTMDLRVEVDLRADAPLVALELEVTLAGLHVRDTVSGAVPALVAQGVWPVWSGLAAVVVPADEVQVAGRSLMPALLAPADEPAPVLGLTLGNPAGPGAGPVELTAITLLPATGDNDFAAPGAAVSLFAVRSDGSELGRNDAVAADAADLTVTLATPLLVPAGGTVELELLVGIRTDAPAGRLRLALADSGLAVGIPGSPPGGIRVVAATGQVLPLETAIGNVGPASLADSYINFPNPFAAGHESTTFAYYLRRPATVTLRLLTPHGEDVATILSAASRAAGLHQQDTWSGANGRGLTVRNGVYVAELVVDYDDGQRERVLRKVAVVR